MCGTPFTMYARHGRYLGGERPLRALTRRTVSGRQLQRCEMLWGGSLKQNLDLMNKNRMKRHGVRGKLAYGSEAREGSEQLYVNAARVRGKISNLIRGGLQLRELRGRSQQRP
jgi:hypothetical protein